MNEKAKTVRRSPHFRRYKMDVRADGKVTYLEEHPDGLWVHYDSRIVHCWSVHGELLSALGRLLSKYIYVLKDKGLDIERDSAVKRARAAIAIAKGRE